MKKITLIGFLIMMALYSSAFADPPHLPYDEPLDHIPSIEIRPRNILLIVADDMGVDLSRQYTGLTLTPNAASLPLTPTINRLKNSGLLFVNAWANPVCSPTRAGFLTGRHSFRTGIANAVLPWGYPWFAWFGGNLA